jgi:hypothetical protein
MKELFDAYVVSTLQSRVDEYEAKMNWWRLLYPDEPPHFYYDPRNQYADLIKKYNVSFSE